MVQVRVSVVAQNTYYFTHSCYSPMGLYSMALPLPARVRLRRIFGRRILQASRPAIRAKTVVKIKQYFSADSYASDTAYTH